MAFCIGIYLVVRDTASNVGSIYYGRLPDFELVDQVGQSFNYQQLLGKMWLVEFQSETVASVQLDPRVKRLLINLSGQENSKFNGISLRGDKNTITRLIEDGFHLNEELIRNAQFSPMVLVDASGNIRGYYRMDRENDLLKLRRDIAALHRIS